jgi:hypothetical protein
MIPRFNPIFFNTNPISNIYRVNINPAFKFNPTFKFGISQIEMIKKALEFEETMRKNIFLVGDKREKVIGDRKIFFCETFVVGRDAVFDKKPNNKYFDKDCWIIRCNLFLSLGGINLKDLEVNADVIILANKVRITGHKKFVAKIFWAVGCDFKGGKYELIVNKKKFSRPVIKHDAKFTEMSENHIEACIRDIKKSFGTINFY